MPRELKCKIFSDEKNSQSIWDPQIIKIMTRVSYLRHEKGSVRTVLNLYIMHQSLNQAMVDLSASRKKAKFLKLLVTPAQRTFPNSLELYSACWLISFSLVLLFIDNNCTKYITFKYASTKTLKTTDSILPSETK